VKAPREAMGELRICCGTWWQGVNRSLKSAAST
jgi:hypothetical protein